MLTIVRFADFGTLRGISKPYGHGLAIFIDTMLASVPGGMWCQSLDLSQHSQLRG